MIRSNKSKWFWAFGLSFCYLLIGGMLFLLGCFASDITIVNDLASFMLYPIGVVFAIGYSTGGALALLAVILIFIGLAFAFFTLFYLGNGRIITSRL